MSIANADIAVTIIRIVIDATVIIVIIIRAIIMIIIVSINNLLPPEEYVGDVQQDPDGDCYISDELPGLVVAFKGPFFVGGFPVVVVVDVSALDESDDNTGS